MEPALDVIVFGMETSGIPFAARLGLVSGTPLVFDEAPLSFRHAVIALMHEGFITSSPVDSLVQVGSGLPKPEPRFANVAQILIEKCEWYRVFEIAEAAYAKLKTAPLSKHAHDVFQSGINMAAHASNVGWVMIEGQFHVRGTEAEETALSDTIQSLEVAGKRTTASELRAARDDLSRLPTPDVTGAVQHAGAALECLARDISGTKDTLGAIIAKNPQLFPGGTRKVAEGVWGIVSNQGRHLEEGGEPTREEGLMLVGLIAALSGYLLGRSTETQRA